MSTNFGISITGGTVNAGAMAAGENAVATNEMRPSSPASIEGLRAQMMALVDAVRAHTAELDDGDQSLNVAEIAQRELAKEQPNKQSFLGLLKSLAAGVGSVAALASAVTTIEQAAAAIF
jgi:hypothetical protein